MVACAMLVSGERVRGSGKGADARNRGQELERSWMGGPELGAGARARSREYERRGRRRELKPTNAASDRSERQEGAIEAAHRSEKQDGATEVAERSERQGLKDDRRNQRERPAGLEREAAVGDGSGRPQWGVGARGRSGRWERETAAGSWSGAGDRCGR